ncbi:MAG: hypothetical protein RLZZ15_2040, partial [Verrucomicrobiota bacterium]
MNRLASSLAVLVGGAWLGAASLAGAPPELFRKFCFECHDNSKSKPAGGLNLERLVAQPSIGRHAEAWDKIAEALEASDMPPSDATHFPAAAERAAAATWVRGELKAYARDHAGEPGHVTVRRLTSGEYAYALRDLTGVEIETGIDASADSVGGEGFTNFGDVQFVQDASVERYLEAAKRVAEHAVIGAGPLEFSNYTGRSGEELAALTRINALYAAKGFRVVSGEGGLPFGLERYGKAFFVAWYFKHRAALGDPRATVRALAAQEGLTAKFAEHIASVVNRSDLGYPAQDFADRWRALPAPTADVKASLERGRAAAADLQKTLTTWPSWFFGRGDAAAGGQGDESPLRFDDSALTAEPTHSFVHVVGGGRFFGGRGRGGPAPTPGAPLKVFLTFTDVNPSPGAKPVVLWRNARIVTRGAPVFGARGAATANVGDVVGAGAGGRRFQPGPILSTQPLRTLLSADAIAALQFGKSADGTALGEDDLAATGTISFEIAAPAAGTSAELQVDAELGAERGAVVRLVIADRIDSPPARGQKPVLLGDPASAGYRNFRANLARYLALLPPNSHGEANPSDKDPVPLPFDSTYNTPEHDAFVLKVKYQRDDAFFATYLVDDADRARLNHAWNDLLGSWPYHDGYLEVLGEHYAVKLKSPHLQDLDAAQIAALPVEMQRYLAPVRASYDEVTKAQRRAEPGHIADALAFASRAWRRPLTAAEKTGLRTFYQHSRTANALDHDDAIRAVLARVLVSPAFLYRVETVASRAERPLDDWELASRLSFFLWSSIPDEELRRAAGAGELRKPALLAQQVKRMTADPKARRLATEFFGQWLGFYRFDQYRGIDTGRFPEFTEEVRAAMYDEAVATFDHLVRHERPVKEILHADYTFLNQPLAKFYGIEKAVKSKDAVELVEGANAFQRGGALRLGAVLAITSAPLRTSPV